MMRKTKAVIALSLAVLFIFAGCADSVVAEWPVRNPTPSGAGIDTPVTNSPERVSTYDGPPGTWAIYWYICGADLESFPYADEGAATIDLQEMMSAVLPENVTVVIETGGAAEWKNDFVSADELGRYTYIGDELRQVDALPVASMGDPNTFADFLRFCNDQYPAEKQAVILWDHGGGSLLGVQFDELFYSDSLSLPEFKDAIESVPAVSGAYELVGFDACLMATLEIADILVDDARYFVASQEVEPVIGWDYSGLFNALAADTTMDGAQLGRAICDTFFAECERYLQSPEELTLSVIDLNKTEQLIKAFNAAGDEALMMAVKEKEAYLSRFRRAALETKSFGDGDYEMVDLGDLVRNAGALLPQTGAALLSALEDCVTYQVRGEYHAGASGLSCYYNLSGSPESVEEFRSLGVSRPVSYFCEYGARGVLSEEALAYVDGLAAQAGQSAPVVAPLPQPSEMGLDGFPVSVGANGRWQMNLGPERMQNVAEVFTNLYWVDTVSGLQAMYGVNSDLTADYERGLFTEDFTDTWGCIDNMQVYMEPIGTEPGLIRYAVPIMLNSEEYTLHVGYNTRSGEYDILGAWKDSAGDKVPSKTVRQLEVGDVIEPIQLLLPLHSDGSRSEEWMPLGLVTVAENTRFHERNIGMGYFALMFKIVDYAGNVYTSAQASFRVRQGKIERLPGGIVPMATEQPPGSFPAYYLEKETFRHPDRNEDIAYYTVVLDPKDYQSMKEELGLPYPAFGDQISGTGGYTIQIYSDTLNLDKYVDASEFYLIGIFFGAETIYHQRDIVMRVDEIVEVW